MAELYDQKKIYAKLPTAQPAEGVDGELEAMLAELPPEERDAARQYITAAPTGEDVYKAMQEKNASGEVFNMNLDQYRLYKSYIKNKETDIIETMGQAAGGVFDEIMKAGGSIADDPTGALAKFTPSLIEAFAQGTRSLYGMAAQSQDPTSVFFRVKNALSANGDDEAAEFQQFMDAQAFNVHSMRLATGQDTLVMDKDVINPEMTQVMSYIADPTLFVPFGGIAAKGARLVGMGEGLAKASARAAQIQRKILGGTLKWGVGAPIEFLGTATRNTIDYGLERAGTAFETVTGMSAAEAKTSLNLYGQYSVSAALEGRNVALPIAGDIAGAMVGSTTAKGVGESISMIGEQMLKQQKHGRGVLSYAGQALRDAEKSGVPLSKHARALLNVIDKADPLFVYSADLAKGAGEGMFIGGFLGGLSGGEEGLASGAGAGLALGTVGAGLGSVVSDIGNGRLYDRIAVQRQMVIEGLRQVDPAKASAFEALVAAVETTGNRDYIAQTDGIIAGIDLAAPNAKFNIRDTASHIEWLRSQKIDPDTGRLMEPSAILPEFGGDRKARGKVLSFLGMVNERFKSKDELLGFIKTLPQDHALRREFFRLDDKQKQVVFDTLGKHQDAEYRKQFGNKSAGEFYKDLNYGEANVARVNAMFDSGNKTRANEMIRQMLKDETVNGELTERGKLLKEKLATEGYFDKDGNMRPSRLKDVELTAEAYANSAGFVIRRDSTGQVEININLDAFGKDTVPHELFHAIMMESAFKPDFTDRLAQNLLGKFDANGKMIERPSVDTAQVKKFFARYIDALHGRNPIERDNEIKRLDAAIKEYESRGTTNKIAEAGNNTLETMVEEFGAYYFGKFINDKPVDFLFRGGELGAMREMLGNAKQGWLDFWRSKIKGQNPTLDFDNIQGTMITTGFGKNGVRARVTALDLFMRDFVRATAMANRNGAFDISRLSPEAQRTFIKNQGIRVYGNPDANGRIGRKTQRQILSEQIITGKEIYKILSGLDPELRKGLTIDGEGNLSGRLSPEAMEAIVQSGKIDRAWVDKIQNAYNILDGKGSNIIYFGYLGRTAQIGDYAWPRLVGNAVPFKNRAAVLLDVDFKVGKDGKMYALFHTLDKAVIDGRADVLWSDSAIRQLWNNDRAAMEADFFRYLSNASKAADDPSRVQSNVLLEDGTGKGAMRRNVLHQMLGMVKPEGDVYLNKPIAEIPYGIRHSVTTFSVDGISNMRVGSEGRWDIVPQNAFKDLARNFQPSEMTREETPNGSIIKHPLGYNFVNRDNKVYAYNMDGTPIGVFGDMKSAAESASANYKNRQVKIGEFARSIEQKQKSKAASFQPIESSTRQQALAPDGDLFSTDEIKSFTEGTRVVKQTQQEFVAQRIQEMLNPENKDKLKQIVYATWENFREIRDIENELRSQYSEVNFDLEATNQEVNRLTKEIATFISEGRHILDNPNHPDKKLIEYYANGLEKQKQLHERMSQIIRELDRKGITDKASEYWKTKTAFESFEKGDINKDVAATFLESILQKEYNSNYKTGEAVTFVANHGTPNYDLIASKMYDTSRLGENTGSQSAKKATFFAGHDTTAINYIGVPLEPNWINSPDYAWYFDFERIKQSIRNNYSKPDEVIKNTELLFNEVKQRLQRHDTSKGVKNEIEKILSPLEQKSKTEALNVSLSWLQRLSNHMVDVGTTFGGVERDWKEAGRPPHLMRQLVKMQNPFVFEYTRADFRDVTFNEVIMKATEAGHDGVIFKNAKDGGSPDIIYALISDKPNDAIKVFDTAHDSDAVNRGVDERGVKIMNGKELGLMFQPAEGGEPIRLSGKMKEVSIGAEGRGTYDPTDRRFTNGFIGRYAEENPDTVKGKNLQFIHRKDGSYRVTLTDNTVSGESSAIGQITARINDVDGVKEADISSHINKEHRGKNLSYVAYSEMAERLRQMGVEYVTGTIVNKDGVPVHIRNKIIGDTFISSTGKPATRELVRDMVRAKQAMYRGDAGVEVYNKLDPKARYQPAEGDSPVPDVNFDELIRLSKIENNSRGRGKQYTPEQLSFSFIGRYAEERPSIIKNKELFYSGSGYTRSLVLKDSDTGLTLGHISLHTGDFIDKVAYIQIAEVSDQGKGYGTLLYSELAERLRSEGYTSLNGRIVDNEGRPFKIRKKIIDQENERIGKETSTILGDKIYSPLHPEARYQPSEYEGGRTYTPRQMSKEFIGRYAEENPNILAGLKIRYEDRLGEDEPLYGRKHIILEKDGKEIGIIKFELEDNNFYINNNKSISGKFVQDISVKVKPEYQGNKYQHLLYSEMFERARSLGAIAFKQDIENKLGLPLKSTNKIVGHNGSVIWTLAEHELQKPTQENFNRLIANAPSVKSNYISNVPFVSHFGTIDPNAHYQPRELEIINITRTQEGESVGKGQYDLDQQIVDRLKKSFKFPAKLLTVKDMLQFIIDNDGHMAPLAKEMISSLDEHGLGALIKQQTTTLGASQKGIKGGTFHSFHPAHNSAFMVLERNLESRRKYNNVSYEYLMMEEMLHSLTIAKAPEPIRHGSTVKDTLKNVEHFLRNKEKYEEQYDPAWNKTVGYSEEWWTIADAYKKVHDQWKTGKFSDGTEMSKYQKNTIEYRLSNMGEFTIGVTQTKDVQRILSEIKVPRKEGFLTNIFNAIKKIWGFGDDAMDSLLSHTSDAMEKVIKRQKTESEKYDSGRFKDRAKQYFEGLNETKMQPAEGTNAPVNEQNKRSILKSIETNAKSVAALKEGKKKPEERTRNYITIDNINPEMLRGEAVVMHSPDNAGIEPVQIGRFTVQQKGGMRYPIEEFTEGWASMKTGLSKDINELGDDNAKRGKGWWSPLALIKGIPEKNRGTHSGFEIFIRNIQNLVDNGVMSEDSAKRVIKAGFNDADTALPLDAMADKLISLSTSNEGKYSITKRREAIDFIVPQVLWNELGKSKGIGRLEPHIKGFKAEGITTSRDFAQQFLSKIYEAAEDPLTKHAKVGEVYAYVIFRSKTAEPASNKHPSYKYSVAPEQGGKPVQLDILSTPMPATKAFTKKIVAGVDVSLVGVPESSFKASTGQQNIPTARGRFQPAEGWRDWKAEKTTAGSVVRNTAGYVIMQVGNKHRVYNPYKAVIGVYDNEEQAKKRVQREEPKR